MHRSPGMKRYPYFTRDRGRFQLDTGIGACQNCSHWHQLEQFPSLNYRAPTPPQSSGPTSHTSSKTCVCQWPHCLQVLMLGSNGGATSVTRGQRNPPVPSTQGHHPDKDNANHHHLHTRRPRTQEHPNHVYPCYCHHGTIAAMATTTRP
ncbi:hypothetical protein BJV78DRAFT_633477 [Lactifluus subvellereus]|nr:hypothetical protein BJV78DRAFT_633477 [Lactifluus subvellereus]